MQTLKLKLFFLLCLFCSFAFAMRPEIDRNLPIHIQSDKATFQQTMGQATYEGNVVMRQGSHKLQANKLIIQKQGNSSTITAVGTPATFQGQLGDDAEPVYATAKIIYYYPEKQLITLEGSATLDHRQDKFRGPILSYEIEKQIVSARSQNNERPTITMHPQVSQR